MEGVVVLIIVGVAVVIMWLCGQNRSQKYKEENEEIRKRRERMEYLRKEIYIEEQKIAKKKEEKFKEDIVKAVLASQKLDQEKSIQASNQSKPPIDAQIEKKLHCKYCWAEIRKEYQYCRACGINLSDIDKILD